MGIQNLEDLFTSFGKQRKILLLLPCLLASVYWYLDGNKSKLRSSEGTFTRGWAYLLPQRKLVSTAKKLMENVDKYVWFFISNSTCMLRDLYILLRKYKIIRKHEDLCL